MRRDGADAVLQTDLPGIISGCITPPSWQRESRLMHDGEWGRSRPSVRVCPRTDSPGEQSSRWHLGAAALTTTGRESPGLQGIRPPFGAGGSANASDGEAGIIQEHKSPTGR